MQMSSILLCFRMISYLGPPRLWKISSTLFSGKRFLPCLLCILCLKDTCTLDETKLRDPRRLYAPGRLYHIIVRKPFKFGKIPPMVRTAVPVDGRFEHLILSCNLTSDHAIVWIERESQRAFDLMLDTERIMEIPAQQRMERFSSYGTFDEINEEGNNASSLRGELPFVSPERRKESWDDLAGRLFDIDESGQMVRKK